jgi:hypothetical protein
MVCAWAAAVAGKGAGVSPHSLAPLTLVMVVLMAGCGRAPSTGPPPTRSPAVYGQAASGSAPRARPTTTVALPSPAPCSSASLRARGGRQGAGFGIAHADVQFTNGTAAACTLSGAPTVAILGSGGSPLAVQSRTAPDATLASVVLPAGVINAVLLTLSWKNWCGGAPGPLTLRILLAGAAGILTAPFDGPPDYDYLPTCQSAADASIVEVQTAYTPAN